MTITTSIVFYMVVWTLTFFVINPLWQKSQSEHGDIVPGTPASAPVDAMVRKKAFWTTVWATGVFAVLFVVIEFDIVTLDDLLWTTLPSDR